METNKGDIIIELLSELAPKHCERILQLSKDKYFDDVVFHRVIGGFMAQTGDGQYGSLKNGLQIDRAGMGGSDLPDLEAEFNSEPFARVLWVWLDHKVQTLLIASFLLCLKKVHI